MKLDHGHVVTRATRRVNGVRVDRAPMIGGGYRYEAMAPISDMQLQECACRWPEAYPYSSISHGDDGRLYGVLGTEYLRADLRRFRSAEERIEVADAWRAECEGNAICLIVEAFPEAADGQRDGCRMEVRS